MTAYHRTQRAPLCLLVYAVAIGLIVLGWFFRDEPTLRYVCRQRSHWLLSEKLL